MRGSFSETTVAETSGDRDVWEARAPPELGHEKKTSEGYFEYVYIFWFLFVNSKGIRDSVYEGKCGFFIFSGMYEGSGILSLSSTAPPPPTRLRRPRAVGDLRVEEVRVIVHNHIRHLQGVPGGGGGGGTHGTVVTAGNGVPRGDRKCRGGG